MTRSAIIGTLESMDIHPDQIPDQRIAQAFRLLLQLIEAISTDIEKLREENQKLRDEINLLKSTTALQERSLLSR